MPENSSARLGTELARARGPADFHGALRRELSEFDQLHESVCQQECVTLACREGCSLCCHLRVDVRPPEAFLIADHVRRTFSPAELEALGGRLQGHSEKIARLTVFEHVTQNIPCPLLQNGRCSVYSVRPQACRRYHSRELAACEYSFENPDDIEFPGARHDGLFRELGAAMEKTSTPYNALGFDPRVYELGSALFEALTAPASWRRWRDGKKAFLQASVTPSADEAAEPADGAFDGGSGG